MLEIGKNLSKIGKCLVASEFLANPCLQEIYDGLFPRNLRQMTSATNACRILFSRHFWQIMAIENFQRIISKKNAMLWPTRQWINALCQYTIAIMQMVTINKNYLLLSTKFLGFVCVRTKPSDSGNGPSEPEWEFLRPLRTTVLGVVPARTPTIKLVRVRDSSNWVYNTYLFGRWTPLFIETQW